MNSRLFYEVLEDFKQICAAVVWLAFGLLTPICLLALALILWRLAVS